MDDDITSRNIATNKFVYAYQKLENGHNTKTLLRDTLGSDDPLTKAHKLCYKRCKNMMHSICINIVGRGGNGYKRIYTAACIQDKALDILSDIFHDHEVALNKSNLSTEAYEDIRNSTVTIIEMSREYFDILSKIYASD